MSSKLEEAFPNLREEEYRPTSPISKLYNCIAWAAGRVDRWWEPVPFTNYYWPPTAPLIKNLESYTKAFQSLGYEQCDDASLELGFEKVAIYCKGKRGDEPEHMARQLPSGWWTSKLGRDVDIEHQTLEGVEGNVYGHVEQVLKRPIETASSPNLR